MDGYDSEEFDEFDPDADGFDAGDAGDGDLGDGDVGDADLGDADGRPVGAEFSDEPTAGSDDPPTAGSDDPPTEGWSLEFLLDDDFVASAAFREPSAEERWRRRSSSGTHPLETLPNGPDSWENPDEDQGDGPNRGIGRRRRTGDDQGQVPRQRSGRYGVSRYGSDEYRTDEFGSGYYRSGGQYSDDDGFFDGVDDEVGYRRSGHGRRRTGFNFLAVIVVASLIVVYVLSQFISGFGSRDIRALDGATLGNEDPNPRTRTGDADDTAGGTGGGDGSAGSDTRTEGWPPAPAVKRTTRLAPAAEMKSKGPHEFLMTQPDGSTPVAYDPCREIHYVTSGLAQAPTEGKQLVKEAVARVSELTGLVFVDDGPSDERPSDHRPAYQPERYGERWAPVLISWSDVSQSPRLAEEDSGPDVLGYAGSSAAGLSEMGPKTEPRRLSMAGAETAAFSPIFNTSMPSAFVAAKSTEMVYVSGSVVLDAPDFVSLLAVPGGYKFTKAVLLHELGHLLGLDHVDDQAQLMYPSLQPRVDDFGDGDRQGLAALGRGKCLPDI